MRYLAILLIALLVFEGVRSEDAASTTDTNPPASAISTTPGDGGITTSAGGKTTGAGGSTAAEGSTTAAEGATTGGTGTGAETTGAETGETTAAGSGGTTTGGTGAGETTTGGTAAGEKTTEAPVPPATNQMCPNNRRTNDKIRKKALDMTNWRRSVLAQGQVEKRNGVYMPTAANMQKLRYDCDLELIARDRAEACEALGSEANTADYQENRYYIPKSDVASAEAPRVDAMAASIKEWWKRVRLDEPIGLQCYFRAKHESLQVRTFTRMAWANTNKMGCTVQECGDQWHAVCLYSPPGNKVEERIYIPGTTCTMCPAGTSCDRSLGLCVAPGS
ncbi:unnamed protein product [Cylicocyclus nassatus]|uniref:SCP domain-containing protein n=1 Tax=Cylicocyclus nassatus TaxID=53992 RepID=A0AA36GPP0_CYLNA|nr:unnamed protein product [Cylicocyclus nassatus]CAJ0595921.1 unnamed protein product [Cylicocyclus nassatus]